MPWSPGRRVYLPLVLLFWLFGSVGSFVLGEEVHHMPPALGAARSSLSQGLESLVSAAISTEVHATGSEIGPNMSTAQANPPRVTTTSTSPSAAPAAPAKAKQGSSGGNRHGNGGDKGLTGGGKGDGKGDGNKGKGGGDDSGDSGD